MKPGRRIVRRIARGGIVRGRIARGRIALSVVLLVSCAGVGACTERNQPAAPEPVHLSWQEITLPPTASGERVALRAAVVCAGRWYLTGAIHAADGTPRPVVWRSPDGRSWTALTLRPKTYYGRLNTLYSVGCRDGRVAAIGDKTGGVHGNPRTSTWHDDADGSLSEVTAYFELFGGNNAVNASRIAGGPGGWVIAGNRRGGAAVWFSNDATEFRVIEQAPGLANDQQGSTLAVDVVASRNDWIVVGSFTPKGGIDRNPGVWTSADGLQWRRIEVSGTAEYEELQRVVAVGDQVVAVGPLGGAVGAWRGDGSSWQAVGRFGSSGGPGHGGAESLTLAAGRLFAATTDGVAYSLWQSQDTGTSWRQVALPVSAPAGFGLSTYVIGDEHHLILVMNDGHSSRAWIAPVGRGT